VNSAAAASLTAVHLAIAILRRHRTRGRCSVRTWRCHSRLCHCPGSGSSTLGMAVGLIAHIICSSFVKFAAPAPEAAVAPRPAAAPPARRRSAAARCQGFEPVPVLAVLDEAADIKTFRLGPPIRLRLHGRPVHRRQDSDRRQAARADAYSHQFRARGAWLPRESPSAGRPRIANAARHAAHGLALAVNGRPVSSCTRRTTTAPLP